MVNDSFERCINDPLFLDQFYEIFLASSDEVSAMFKDTDMGTQTDDLAGIYERCASRFACLDS